jgi:N-acetylneuraminic acid mutarotase
MTRLSNVRTLLTGAFLGIVGTMPTLAEENPAPQAQKAVRPMLKIAWSRGPDLPQGLQDGNVGVIGNTLVMACGFCSGQEHASKPGRYPRGFLNKVWGLELTVQQNNWQRLPDYPGTPRQGLAAIGVGDVLYFWGGFNYSAPFCYKDGYRLTRHGGKWIWEALPDFPWPVCSVGLCTIGSRVYAFGGADYDENRFYTHTDRTGKNERQGARLLVLDTSNAAAGWKRLADCPGTPRWVNATAVVNGKVYVIGGATGDLALNGKNYGYCTVVDNWVYDPGTDQWDRLRDLPISSGNFPAGKIVFKDRYILLIGGFQYAHVANPDGTVREKYGTAHQFQDKGSYYNDVFVYDTATNLFGTADSLPINNNAPMAVVWNDEVFVLGGETGSGTIDGVFYGHHPDLFLRGGIEVPR